jgi:hypothetical protein
MSSVAHRPARTSSFLVVAVATLAALAVMLAGAPGSASAASYTEKSWVFKPAPGSKSCPVGPAALGGRALCGTTGFELKWTGSKEATTQTFVIGLDHAVYYLLQRSSGSPGWVSLSGWAKTGVYSEYVYSPSSLGIRTYGSDSRRWCINLNRTWGSWHLCPTGPS